MPVITIPFDYDEKAYPSVVPICICDTDANGNQIHPAWFELGVAPVADQLRRMTRRVLNDVCRVSEITESAVHSVWRSRGSDLGTNPELVCRPQAREVARRGCQSRGPASAYRLRRRTLL